ncbi:MAG TPA: endopeptidase La [Vicinamibacterales bacterium]|nr:endopeptidase La [Vicinamibacterales bacterium]
MTDHAADPSLPPHATAPAPPERTDVYPSELPVLALRQTVALPLTLQPLAVNRPVSIDAVNRALGGDRLLLLLLQKTDAEDPSPADLHTVGTIGIIRQMAKVPGGGVQVLVEGLVRARALAVSRTEQIMQATVAPSPDRVESSLEIDAYMRRIHDLVDRALSLASGLSQELRNVVMGIDEPLRLCYLLASLLDIKAEQKQQLLEAERLVDKLEQLTAALTREIALLEIRNKIESQTQQQMTDQQRQYYLRQQLKTIQEELGEGEKSDVGDLRKRVEDAHLPEAVAQTVLHEVDRLDQMSPMSPEYQMVRTYVDWVLDVPWTTTTEDRLDPIEARRVLDADHYDLDKVKERIVEYLAVRKLKGDLKGPILCFVGAPGVGKTSLGQSIARAMNRKFMRISLGGVRDEAEIRGHRRTYIGAMPGRIIQALKQVGAANPVFMLDEIDKLSVGFQGDPAAALLEVLDPAQNHAFRDHYLEIPFDLSRVLFIATANQLGPVQPALLDRMEIIELPGYTGEEKLHIARRYLLPRQLTENGLPPGALELRDDALRLVVSEYTREAGVRSLERRIGTIARKIAARVATRPADAAPIPQPLVVDAPDVAGYLGPPRFHRETVFRTSRPGVATGVAWTETGGDVLFIEASLLPGGAQNIILTGQLGSVMQESARAAVSHIRAHAAELGVADNFLDHHDLHIHVPAGAIPKDGPSAGVTMATAILSAVRKQPVSPDVAMTGEITLTGLVLPVGGIREKALAARRYGITTFILPALNEPDIAEMPAEVRGSMTFVLARTLDDVLQVALPAPAVPPSHA